MARQRRPYDDDDEEVFSDDESEEQALDDGVDSGPGEHDAHLMDDDQPFRTIPCTQCGRPVWDEAERCNHCGHLFPNQAFNDPSRTRSMAWTILVVVLIVLMLLALLMGRPLF